MTQTHLEVELEQLEEAVMEMMELVKKQLEKTQEALLNLDVDVAEEVIHNEKRVNAMELSIDRDCENIFALFNPVAKDMRFVIAALKINSDLERIADLSEGIAKYVLDMETSIDKELLRNMRLSEMFDVSVAMMNNLLEAFEEGDTSVARKLFKKDKVINEIHKSSIQIIKNFAKKDVENNIDVVLYLASTIKKIERIGDHAKNITEDLIFYIDAEVLKHKKKNKNKNKNKKE